MTLYTIILWSYSCWNIKLQTNVILSIVITNDLLQCYCNETMLLQQLYEHHWLLTVFITFYLCHFAIPHQQYWIQCTVFITLELILQRFTALYQFIFLGSSIIFWVPIYSPILIVNEVHPIKDDVTINFIKLLLLFLCYKSLSPAFVIRYSLTSEATRGMLIFTRV